jgi:uncharacterized protein (DUF4415 family)
VDRAKLKALASPSDSEIDTSDIPEMTEITARVDADVLDWLKA